MFLKFFVLSISILLLMHESIFAAVSNIVYNINTFEWPLISINYKREALPLEKIYIKIDGIDKKIKPQKIEKQQNIKQKNLLIAIDTSRSLTQEYLNAIKFSIQDYVKHVNEDFSIAILSFNDFIQIHIPFTKDKKQIVDSLKMIKQGGGKTELYKAIDSAVSLISSKDGYKSLLVITDGHDESTTHDTTNIIKKAVDYDVKIHIIGLPDKDAKNKDFLNIIKNLSEKSKGAYEYCDLPISLSSSIISILNKHHKESVEEYKIVFDIDDINLHKSGNVECILTDTSGSLTKNTKFSFSVPESVVKKISIDREYVYIIITVGVFLLILLCVLLVRKKHPASVPQSHHLEKDETSGFVIEFYTLGMIFPLPYGRITIGASNDNSIILQDPTVSRHHAVLEITKKGCRIEDMKSTNGIYVNGGRISRPMYLKPGDKLYLGKAEAVIRQIASAKQ